MFAQAEDPANSSLEQPRHSARPACRRYSYHDDKPSSLWRAEERLEAEMPEGSGVGIYPLSVSNRGSQHREARAIDRTSCPGLCGHEWCECRILQALRDQINCKSQTTNSADGNA